MERFLCGVLSAALAADRDLMSRVDWSAHGIEAGPYTDRVMCFGFDWDLDVRRLEDSLAGLAVGDDALHFCPVACHVVRGSAGPCPYGCLEFPDRDSRCHGCLMHVSTEI